MKVETHGLKPPVNLHLGCGNVLLSGFINIDSRVIPGAERTFHVSPVDKLGFQDDSVGLIYACHVLEHFHRRDTQRVLREWYRVLQPGGTLRLAVPDFEACAKVYDGKNLALLLGHLVGGQEYPENIHYMVFDFAYLSTLLSEVGFRCIRRYRWFETEHYEYDDKSQGYYPHMDKKNGTLMSLNVECDK